MHAEATNRLTEFLTTHRRVLVLSGAGCSTESGIPDYRDLNGGWKHPQPMTYQAFVANHATRQRYWARSLVGWHKPSQPYRLHRPAP